MRSQTQTTKLSAASSRVATLHPSNDQAPYPSSSTETPTHSLA
jgi:hypothetical protein